MEYTLYYFCGAMTNAAVGVEEIMLIAANSCGQWINGVYYSYEFMGTPDSYYINHLGSYTKKFYYDSDGFASKVVHYTDHGNPANHSNPHYHTFSAVYNERLQGFRCPA